MRNIAAVAVFVVLWGMASFALAADGQHANLKMTSKIDMGENAPTGLAGMDQPNVMLGEVWLTDNRMRMDVDSGMGFKSISLMDLNSNEMYTLDPNSKTAFRIDLSKYQEMAGGFGGDFTNPSNMFKDWDSYIEMLDQTPGLTYQLLGEKTINGQECRGLSFVVDTSKMMENVDTSEMPGGEMMGAMGDYTGELWYSDAVRMMPVYMTADMEMMGMKMAMQWELLDVTPWTPTDNTFAIPEGYTVKDFSEQYPANPDFQVEEEGDGGEEAAPAEAA